MNDAAVDQRLVAMLEELEAGIRRSRELDRRQSSSLQRKAEPFTARGALNTIVLEPGEHLTAGTRAAAIITIVLGIGGLGASLFSWATTPAPTMVATTESGIALSGSQDDALASAHVASKKASIAGGLAQPLSNGSTGAEQTTPAYGGAGGLSIEDYNSIVRQLLARHRAQRQDAATASEKRPEDAPARDTPSPAIREAPANASTPMGGASPAPAPSGLLESGHKNLTTAAFTSRAKAKATAPGIKHRRIMSAKMRVGAPSSHSTPARIFNGPVAMIQRAKETLDAIISRWRRIGNDVWH